MVKYLEKKSNTASLYRKKIVKKPAGHIVWPMNEKLNKTNYIRINNRDRCICKYRISYDGQCAHELCISFAFREKEFNPRWLNNMGYTELYPNNQVRRGQYHDINTVSQQTLQPSSDNNHNDDVNAHTQ